MSFMITIITVNEIKFAATNATLRKNLPTNAFFTPYIPRPTYTPQGSSIPLDGRVVRKRLLLRDRLGQRRWKHARLVQGEHREDHSLSGTFRHDRVQHEE